jgi:hypothetical protein
VNTGSLAARLRRDGMQARDVARLFKTFNAAAPEFRVQSAAEEAAGEEGRG